MEKSILEASKRVWKQEPTEFLSLLNDPSSKFVGVYLQGLRRSSQRMLKTLEVI